jgi:hypothetical protein
MVDNVLGIFADGRCPKCKRKKLTCIIQYPLIIETDLKNVPIFRSRKTGRRKKPSNSDEAICFRSAIRQSEYQCIQYICNACHWTSDIYTP